MSKGGWLLLLAIGGLAHAQDKPVVLYNDAVLVCDETGCRERSSNSAENISAEQRAGNKSDNDENAGQEWSVIQIAPHSEPEQPERKEETERAERDINAQEAMASWAGISAGLALFALIGLFLTLWETRRIGQSQTRAYLSGIHAEVIDPDFSFAAFDIVVIVKNFGQSPAFDFKWSIDPTLQYFGAVNHLAPDESDLKKFEPFESPTVISAQTATTFRFFIEESDVAAVVQNRVGGDLYLVGSINLFWKDVFGRKHVGKAWIRPFNDADSLPDFRGKLMVTNHAPDHGDKRKRRA
jgi:hypothetical protein